MRSPAFTDGGEIPRKNNHDGKDASPPLKWDDVPEAAKSLALVVEDPDFSGPSQPGRMWIHWVITDLPPNTRSLPENIRTLTSGVIGLNDWDRASHAGECARAR